MSIYNELLARFGGRTYSIPKKGLDEPATVADLLVLLQKVNEHYDHGSSSMKDLDEDQKSALMVLFDKLAGHYSS